MLIPIILWAVVVVILLGIGWRRLRQGFTDLIGLAFDASTLPLKAVWGLRWPLFWSAMVDCLLSMALLTTGLAFENRFLVALGGLAGGLYLAFWWLCANSLAWYITKLVEGIEHATTLFYRALVAFLQKLGLVKAEEFQQRIEVLDQELLRKRISQGFGFATAVWFALMVYLVVAPYWVTFFTLPVLTLFALAITFFGMQWKLGRSEEGKPNKTAQRAYSIIVVVFWIYLATAFFSIVAARSDALYSSLPHSMQPVARYLGAMRDQASTRTARVSLPPEVDASMTLVEVLEDTYLYKGAKKDNKVSITSKTKLEKGKRVACINPKPEALIAGLEPVVEVALPDKDTGEFVTLSEQGQGWVVARKISLRSPLSSDEERVREARASSPSPLRSAPSWLSYLLLGTLGLILLLGAFRLASKIKPWWIRWPVRLLIVGLVVGLIFPWIASQLPRQARASTQPTVTAITPQPPPPAKLKFEIYNRRAGEIGLYEAGAATTPHATLLPGEGWRQPCSPEENWFVKDLRTSEVLKSFRGCPTPLKLEIR